MKRKIIYIILIALACLSIATTLIDNERIIDHKTDCIKSLQEELKETKVDSEYYKSQYKKYYELSKELEKSVRVYSN